MKTNGRRATGDGRRVARGAWRVARGAWRVMRDAWRVEPGALPVVILSIAKDLLFARRPSPVVQASSNGSFGAMYRSSGAVISSVAATSTAATA